MAVAIHSGLPPMQALGRTEPTDLGGDHRLAPSLPERAAEELLRLPAAVALGGVEVVNTGVEARVDDRLGALFVHAHAEVVAAEPGHGHLERSDLACLRHPRNLFSRVTTVRCAHATADASAGVTGSVAREAVHPRGSDEHRA